MRPGSGAGNWSGYRLQVNDVRSNAVNDRIRESSKVKLPVISPDFPVPHRVGHDSPKRAFKLIKEVISQSRLALFIPQRRTLEFLLRFRMTDDIH